MKDPTRYISNHLLIFIGLALSIGIAFSNVIKFTETETTSFTIILIFLLFLLAILYYTGKKKTALVLLLPLVAGLGLYHGHQHLQTPDDNNHLYHIIDAKREVVLIGTMVTMAGFNGKTSQVTIAAKSLRFKDKPNLVAVTGKVLLRLLGPWPDSLSPGDTLVIRTELKRPYSYRTPGVFDYAQYLARRDIWTTGLVRSPIFLHKLRQDQSILHTLRYLPERIRMRIGKQIDLAVPAKERGIYRAILLGDRTQVSDATLETFKGSGTMHILAISGLHMAIIGALLYASIYWFLSRSEKLLLRFTLKKWAAFLSLPILLGYGLLAGLNTPVLRAVIMSAIVIVSICTGRQKSLGTLLCFAAIFILIINPSQLFTVSFQLSFTAVIGIVFLLPILKNLILTKNTGTSKHQTNKTIINWIIAGLLVSLVATLVTAPIALYSFNRFSIVGPIANLFVEPLICLWSLPMGFFAILFMFIEPTISSLLLQIGTPGLTAAMKVTALFSSFTFSSVWLTTPSPWLIFVYFFLLVIFASWGWQARWRSILCIVLISACGILFVHPVAQLWRKNHNTIKMTYLDVGHGSATLLEYPSGFRVLIDAGGSSFTATTVGERIIAPFLWNRGIKRIDALVITHPDADHYNGASFIIEHFSPAILWVRDRDGHDNRFKQLIRLATSHHILVRIPIKGQRLETGSGYLECIANTLGKHNAIDTAKSRNLANSGLIIKACYQKLCSLFPGDIAKAEEQSLVDNDYDLTADILLASHHGSKTSNSDEFLRAVAPQYLLVSAGRSRQDSFSHDRLKRDCKRRRITLISTARQGTLEIVADRAGYQLYGYTRVKDNPLHSFDRVLLANTIIE